MRLCTNGFARRGSGSSWMNILSNNGSAPADTWKMHAFVVLPTALYTAWSGAAPAEPDGPTQPSLHAANTWFAAFVEYRPARTILPFGCWFRSVVHGVEPVQLKPHEPSGQCTLQ